MNPVCRVKTRFFFASKIWLFELSRAFYSYFLRLRRTEYNQRLDRVGLVYSELHDLMRHSISVLGPATVTNYIRYTQRLQTQCHGILLVIDTL